MLATQRKSTFTNQLIFLLVVAFIMGGGYIYMNRHAMGYYFDKYASHIPFFYTSVNDYLSTNINSTPVAKLSRSTASFFPAYDKTENISLKTKDIDSGKTAPETTDNDDITEVIIENPNVDIKSEIVSINTESPTESTNNNTDLKIYVDKNIVSESVVPTKHFFLIAGSFSKESNASLLVSQLKSEGFKALIADTNKYGMYRVAFMKLNNRTIAENQLTAIRNDTNPKAWLLVK